MSDRASKLSEEACSGYGSLKIDMMQCGILDPTFWRQRLSSTPTLESMFTFIRMSIRSRDHGLDEKLSCGQLRLLYWTQGSPMEATTKLLPQILQYLKNYPLLLPKNRNDRSATFPFEAAMNSQVGFGEHATKI